MPKDASLCSVWCNDLKKKPFVKSELQLNYDVKARPDQYQKTVNKKKGKDENSQPLLFTMTIRSNYQLSANRKELLQRP